MSIVATQQPLTSFLFAHESDKVGPARPRITYIRGLGLKGLGFRVLAPLNAHVLSFASGEVRLLKIDQGGSKGAV